MDIKNVTNFYKIFNNEGIALSYQGPFVQEMIEEISSVMNKKISDISDIKLNSRYFSLFVEQAQNILHYSSEKKKDNSGGSISYGLILTGVQDGNIFIISGNPIESNHEKVLKQKLDNLKNCSRDELNQMFKDQLRSNNDNKYSKGASLGLIELSRKSDNLEYHFDKLNSGQTFFTLKTIYDPQLDY